MSENKNISNSLNQFSFKLYNALSSGKNENFFISPFSISTALSMCYVGAGTETADQLKQLLGLNGLSSQEILDLNSQYLTHLNGLEGSVSLNTANKIYPHNGFELKPEFTNSLIKYFKSEAQTLDYSKPNESAKTINDWVAKQTNDKIKDLIEPSLLDPLTRLVLVNAIYFKGNWMHRFNRDQTYKEDFYLSDGTTKKVDMMKLTDNKFRLQMNPQGLPALTCEFPYTDRSVSMTIFLPHEGVGLEAVESKLNDNVLKEVFTTHVFVGKVHAYIPKFKLEYKSELSESLSALGAPLPFSQTKADFSGISESQLHISKVVHQAVVEVNEEGTVAAAATGVAMNMKCFVREAPPEEFKCNRPFLFVIHDTANNGILFIGKYVKPN